MKKAAAARWKNLKAVELAAAIYAIVKDNEDLLKHGTAKPPKSVWGKIVYHKFKVNTYTDRHWAYVAFHRNAADVAVRKACFKITILLKTNQYTKH